MNSLLLDQRNFVVGASQDRVWRLIGKVIFSSLPGLENMEILDENTFRALLRTQILGFRVSLKLKGEIVDMEPPNSFSVKLFLAGPGGFFKADQKVTFAMTPVEQGKTALACKAAVENMGFLPRLLLLGEARRFARSTFEAIEKRLKELA
ncbi:MAG: SRPBCC domain-containing protein [Deltaproteobacteria bacterium]|nr:SRPBCC domain-containing protein [Deltaproteobacteria bacterium]